MVIPRKLYKKESTTFNQMHQQYKVVTVEGNIGAGKTSLASMLAKEYNASLILEEFADNPFLSKFYAAPERYALATETFFLLDRFEQLTNFLKKGIANNQLQITDYILRKTLLYASVNLPVKEEYLLFEKLFHTLCKDVPDPDLLIYIHAKVPQLISNIQQRGRKFEKNVQGAYLSKIEKAYLNYFKQNPQIPILFIHAEGMDFVNNETHYWRILEHLDKEYPPGMHEVSIV